MRKKRKEEIDKILIDTERKILSEEIKICSLAEFKEKRKHLRNNDPRIKKEHGDYMMNNPKTRFVCYLKERHVYYEEDMLDKIPRIKMVFPGSEHCPGKRIESCIYFHDDSIEARVYYANPGPDLVRKSEHISDLYRVMNFLNAEVFPKNLDNADGTLYAPSYLVTPRFFMTEDGCNDITAMVVMDNDLFAVAPLEIEDYITIALPWLMGDLAPYIFGVLFGNANAEHPEKSIPEYLLR